MCCILRCFFIYNNLLYSIKNFYNLVKNTENYSNYQINTLVTTVITKTFKIITVITYYMVITKIIRYLKNIFTTKNKKEAGVFIEIHKPTTITTTNNIKEQIAQDTNSALQKSTRQIIENHYVEKYQTKELSIATLENEINTIWDIIKIKENTQAEHILKTIPSDKWVDIDEIRQRIKIEFNIEYANDKSLYPYIKTLTDISLLKTNNTGKKRSWKKNIILIDKRNKIETDLQ